MKFLLHNIRFYILCGSLLLSIFILRWVQTYIPQGQLQTIRLEQIYAFAAIIFLYLALLIGPLCYTFFHIPYRDYILKARRAIGVSSFYFALLHSWIALFQQLQGFAGLNFL